MRRHDKIETLDIPHLHTTNMPEPSDIESSQPTLRQLFMAPSFRRATLARSHLGFCLPFGFWPKRWIAERFHRPLPLHLKTPDLLHRLPSTLAVKGTGMLIASRDIQLYARCSTRNNPTLGLVHQMLSQTRATI